MGKAISDYEDNQSIADTIQSNIEYENDYNKYVLNNSINSLNIINENDNENKEN